MHFRVFSKGIPEKKEDSISVLVARNPFNRVVSAYLDKLGPKDHKNFAFDPIAKNIIKRYRDPANIDNKCKQHKIHGKFRKKI